MGLLDAFSTVKTSDCRAAARFLIGRPPSLAKLLFYKVTKIKIGTEGKVDAVWDVVQAVYLACQRTQIAGVHIEIARNAGSDHVMRPAQP
jgi:hypothetical protein